MIQKGESSSVGTMAKPTSPPDFYPPCQAACPIHQDARGYLASIARGDFKDSLSIVMDTNPLPAVCGTVCAHPCETKCRRSKVDEALSIRCLKRVAVEYGGNNTTLGPVAVRRKEKVAIIGSGPAGLTAAHDLAKMGFQVTIFERESAPGGVLQNVIPLFRLPRKTVARDISGIQSLGVEIKTRVELGKDFSIADLKAGYQAVVLSLGLTSSKGLAIPGARNQNVLLALPFLKAVNEGNIRIDGKREVIVVGGGNIAIDVARSAVRVGASKVRIVCPESRQEMPAFPWEIEATLEEGVEVECCSWEPLSILEDQGNVRGLRCKKVLAVFDAQGTYNPSYDESIQTTVGGDIVIMAIGKGAELGYLKEMGVALNENGNLIVDRNRSTTNMEGVFACGEVATGPGTAVHSMADGRKAAISIACYLQGIALPVEKESPPLGDIAGPTLDHIKHFPRNSAPILDVEKRKHSNDHVEMVFPRELAARESRRCLCCGSGAYILEEKCVACLTCVRVCPYKVPAVLPGGQVTIPQDNCQACGICVEECPAKAINFRMATVTDLPQRIEASVKGVHARSAHPKILCLHCSYGAFSLDTFALGGKKSSHNVANVSVPCISKIGLVHLLKAFELGVDGVYVAGCDDPTCHLQESSHWAGARLKASQQILKQLGLQPERLEIRLFPDAEVPGLEDAISSFSQKLQAVADGQTASLEAL